ncbi:MAG TPA: DUF748 domain-containing protein [Povalibacter sp.]|nr:DUF748 domain-containing protein [Povalibacter sp.]
MNKFRTLIAPLIVLVRLHWIALCVVAGVLLLYTLAGFFLVPHLAQSQLQSYVTETLHRKVAVGDVRFNPFTFETSISRFALTEADDSPLVAFRHLYVNAELASLWQRAVVLKEVQLAAPDIDLVIAKDGSVNLAQLAPASEEAAPQPQAAPPRVRISTLDVYEGRIGLTDQTLTRPFAAALKPVRFTLTDFKTDVGYRNAYDFAGTTTSGERLEWNGGFTVQPLGSAGQFSVQGLKMETVDSYIYESLPFRLASGDATVSGSYNFALNPTFALDITLPSIEVRNLSFAERSSKAAAPVTIPGIQAHDVTFSYGKRDVALKRLDVKGARVDVAREADGSISLMRLLGAQKAGTETPSTAEAKRSDGSKPASSTTAMADTAAAASTQTPAAADSPDWRVSIETIQLADAAIKAEDHGISPTTRFQLAPVQLTVNGWSTDPAAKLQVDADITIDQHARLTSKGEVQLEPLSTQLAIALSGFELPVLQPYIEDTTAMTLHSGQLGVKGNLSYAATPEKAPPLKFTGEVQVADLRTTDQLVNQDFVKWRNLAVTGIDFTQNPNRLSIDRIVARQPYASVVISKNQTLNVTSVLNPGAAQEPPAKDEETEESAKQEKSADARTEQSGNAKIADSGKAAKSTAKKAAGVAESSQRADSQPPFPIRIKTVQFIDGSANFADYSIEPSFATGILGLSGTVVGLSSDPASRAKVKLDGKVDKYAPVDITGEVNLLSAAKYTDLSMDFRNMELTTFNPYSGKFAGYNISKGKLSTELKYKVEDRKLDAAHHIVVDNLEFGEKTDSKDAAPIPLKLAVALLKDRRGVIDVNLPVSGTLDDPKFRLGPIIWKAVLGLLTKVVTAPFAALGALFGGGEELAYVDFPAGSAELAAPQAEKLTTLSKALVERPQLRLSVPLTVVTAQDSEALARTALAAKVPAAPEQALDDSEKRKRVAVYEKAYKEIMNAAPQYPPETKTEKGMDFDAQLKFLEDSLLQQLRPDDSALTALAQQRARAVQDALLANTELNPERVFITAERTEGKPQDATVRMEMKLE